MRKPYTSPSLTATTMSLGVFGDYGTPGGGDNGTMSVNPDPFWCWWWD